MAGTGDSERDDAAADDRAADDGRGPAPGRRVDILGTGISPSSYARVLTAIEHAPLDRAQILTFCNVHSVMTARHDAAVHRALAAADLTNPDGMPLVWVLRQRGHREQSRVYGPDLMELALASGVPRGWRHFLFGANDHTLDLLTTYAERQAPGVRIVGRHAPPYRPLTAAEDDAIVEHIRASGANLVWVGLGMPKQELWMHRVRDRLPGVTLLGVGAAFDLLSGTVPQAPDWLQERGLEWAYRLWREPRRLWRRYLFNNPAFVALVAVETIRYGMRNRHRG
ncbi:WecB/TagA/CpsF family glycosyltransferase [Nitriliruptor alkaliphilus]|uniref:WecB/TagA/CpsF family glycosyltransferase n=1 Tax=Nitriliruptor alkaliphilus TaxID=427918 RepID=UPI0006978FB3|nr:WecB/TagA/CpsF family glycosyltransferase [Nitriliruptor alkaliphilus]